MLSGRHGHRSLVSKNTIYHIGGDYDKYSNTWVENVFLIYFFRNFEKWTFGKNGIGEELLEVSLTGYLSYPESFLVSTDFCQ